MNNLLFFYAAHRAKYQFKNMKKGAHHKCDGTILQKYRNEKIPGLRKLKG
jgi:hypothetical protein